jgi:hypothetical protein
VACILDNKREVLDQLFSQYIMDTNVLNYPYINYDS